MADEQVLERFVTEFKFRYDKSALAEIESRIERLESGLKRASEAFLKAGATLVGTQASLFTAYSNAYERHLAQLASKTGKAFEQIERTYASDLKRIARDTGRTFAEVADALQKSISAGVEGKKALDLVEQSARSAAAGIGIAAEQVSAATTLMEVFGTTAKRSLDTITKAAQVGEGETSDYARGFKQVAGLANELGLEIDHIAAGLATTSNVAPSLAEASTWLRSFFESMLAPTKDAKDRLADLNEAAQKTDPSGARAQIKTFQQLRDIAKDQGLVTLLATFKEIAGDNPELQKALLGRTEALKLTTSVNVTSLERNLKLIQEGHKGSVDFAFAQQRSWLQFQKMMQAIKEVSFVVGRYVIPPLERITAAIHQAREAFEALPESVKKFMGRIIMAGPVLIGIGVVLWGLSKILRPLTMAMTVFAAKPLMLMTAGVLALAGGFYLLQKNSDRFMQMWQRFKERAAPRIGDLYETAAGHVVPRVRAAQQWFGRQRDAIVRRITGGAVAPEGDSAMQPDPESGLSIGAGGGMAAGAGMLGGRKWRFKIPSSLTSMSGGAKMAALSAAGIAFRAAFALGGDDAEEEATPRGIAGILATSGRGIAAAVNNALASAGSYIEAPRSWAAAIMAGLPDALKSVGLQISGSVQHVLFALFGAWFSYKLIRFALGRALKFASGVWITNMSSTIANWRAMGDKAPKLKGFAGLVATRKSLLVAGGVTLAFLAGLVPAMIAGESAVRGFTTTVVAGVNLAMGALTALGAGIVWAFGRVFQNFTGKGADGYINSLTSFFGRVVRTVVRWTGTLMSGAVGAAGYLIAPLTDPALMLRFGASVRNMIAGLMMEIVRSIPDVVLALLKIVAASIYTLTAGIAGGLMGIIGLLLPRVVGDAMSSIFAGVGSMLMLVERPMRAVIETIGVMTRSLMSFMDTVTLGIFSGDKGSKPSTSNMGYGLGAVGIGALAAGAGALTRYGKWGKAAELARSGWGVAKTQGADWWRHVRRPGIDFKNPLGDAVDPGFLRMGGRALLSPLTWGAPALAGVLVALASKGRIKPTMASFRTNMSAFGKRFNKENRPYTYRNIRRALGKDNLKGAYYTAKDLGEMTWAQMRAFGKDRSGMANFGLTGLGVLGAAGAARAAGSLGGIASRFPKSASFMKTFGRDTLLSAGLYMLPFGEILSMIPALWALGKWGAGTKLGASLGLAGLGAKMGVAGAAAGAAGAGILGKLGPLLAAMGPKGWGIAGLAAGGYGLYKLGSWLFGGKENEGGGSAVGQPLMEGLSISGNMGLGGLGMMAGAGMMARHGMGIPGRAGLLGRAMGAGARGIARVPWRGVGVAGVGAGILGLLGAGYRRTSEMWSGMSTPDGVLGAQGDLRLFSDDEAYIRNRHLIPAFGASYDEDIRRINQHDRTVKTRRIRSLTSDSFGMRAQQLQRDGQGFAANRMAMQRRLNLEDLTLAEMDTYMKQTSLWSRVKQGIAVSAQQVWQKVEASQIDAAISKDNYARDVKRWEKIRRAGELQVDESLTWAASMEAAIERHRTSYWERIETRVIGIAQSMATPIMTAYATLGGWWGKMTRAYAVPSLRPDSRWQMRKAESAQNLLDTRRSRQLAGLAVIDPAEAQMLAYDNEERLEIARLYRDAEAADLQGQPATAEFLRELALKRQINHSDALRSGVVPEAARGEADAKVRAALDARGTGRSMDIRRAHLKRTGNAPTTKAAGLMRHIERLRASGDLKAVQKLEAAAKKRGLVGAISRVPGIDTPMPSTGPGVGGSPEVGSTTFNINVTAPGGNPNEIASAVQAEISQSLRNTSRRLVASHDSNVLS